MLASVLCKLVAVLVLAVPLYGAALHWVAQRDLQSILKSHLRIRSARVYAQDESRRVVGALSPAVGFFGQKIHVRCAGLLEASDAAPATATAATATAAPAALPLTILYHGAGANVAFFTALQQELANRSVASCAFDRPGFGLSPGRDHKGAGQALTAADIAGEVPEYLSAVLHVASRELAALGRFGGSADAALGALRAGGFVHAGHSMGGLFSVLGARAGPVEEAVKVPTRGVALLDAGVPYGDGAAVKHGEAFQRELGKRISAVKFLGPFGLLEALYHAQRLEQPWMVHNSKPSDLRLSAFLLSAGDQDQMGKELALAEQLFAQWPSMLGGGAFGGAPRAEALWASHFDFSDPVIPRKDQSEMFKDFVSKGRAWYDSACKSAPATECRPQVNIEGNHLTMMHSATEAMASAIERILEQ